MKRFGMHALALASCALSVDCAQDVMGDVPPGKSFYYPIGIELAPDQRTAYVISSDFDQRYAYGWLSVIDLDALVAHLDVACGSVGAPGCANETDPALTTLIVQELKLPILASLMGIDPSGSLGVVTARGGQPLSRLTFADDTTSGARARTVSCGDPLAVDGLRSALQKTDCDRDHLTQLAVTLDVDENADLDLLPRVEGVAEDRRFALTSNALDAVPEASIADPYAVRVIHRSGDPADLFHVLVGYVSGGLLSVFTAGPATPLEHILVLGRFNTGIGGLAVLEGNGGEIFVAATSQGVTDGSSVLYDVDLERSLAGPADHLRTHAFGSQLGGHDLLDVVMGAPGASRAYVASRTPDGVLVLDTRLHTVMESDGNGGYDAVSWPRYAPTANVPMPGRPSGMAYVPRATGDLLAVTSFDDDALYLLDVVGDDLRVVRRIDEAGQGPFQVRHAQLGGWDLLLVANFFSHSLGIVDVTPSDPQRFRLLGEIHHPDATPSTERAR